VVDALIFNYHRKILQQENWMFKKCGIVQSVCVATLLASAALWTGCVHRAPRYYDTYYNDYHKWNDTEVDHYHEWLQETHRDPKLEFRTLPADEQEEYWKWRHTREEPSHKNKKTNPS
jgi:hypothetical protein